MDPVDPWGAGECDTSGGRQGGWEPFTGSFSHQGAKEGFPGDADYNRMSQSIVFIQPSQDLKVSFWRLAETDTGIDPYM